MARAPAKATPMCCVSIGYGVDLMLPADKGMKLVEILTHAVEANKAYEHGGYIYTPQAVPEVQYVVVNASRIRMPSATAPEAAADGVVLRALPAPTRRLPR